ncbi:MAG: cyclic nucleotide-binding domain-containing protein [Ramlibacter sp.]|nr:cyclic nucleotide-binding domain-containing protein [Ramlibacter sp.]MCW5651870.1 cyclic nucleotide-binding domain-containing protein [Ramlibacter sp.]
MAATAALNPALAAGGCCEGLSQRPDLLARSALLQDFSPAEADVLGAAMVLVRASAGQVLIAEGTVDDWMMLLLSGTVDVTKRRVDAAARGAGAGDARESEGGDPAGAARLAVLRPGAVIGEMSMLDGEPRYATCVALDDVEAAVLTRSAVARLIGEHPAVGAKLLVKITQLLAQRLRNTSNQLVRSIQNSAEGSLTT